MNQNQLKSFLDKKVKAYNQPSFIEHDPIVIPHMFSKQQDIEIMGFFASVFAWGQRITIINKCKDLVNRMDGAPHAFVMDHSDKELKQLLGFKHRTFNADDLLYFILFFRHWYRQHSSLEGAFSKGIGKKDLTVENGLNHFRNTFFGHSEALKRTYKHIASPAQHSACKRINMYLRWMVRDDDKGVDFGIWKQIKPAQLVCPLDVHVQRVALKLGLLTREQSDWKAASELTANLRTLDAKDPVKYDFALFGLGVMEQF